MLFKKLNYKNEKEVHVLHAPESFNEALTEIADRAMVKRKLLKKDKATFAIGFATTQAMVNNLVTQVAPQLEGDAVFWVCYPKASSKNYTCDFNRDTGWAIMGQYNLEGVRQVAIDEDWSALRFRKIDYIKNFTRNKGMALSEAGKKRATTKK
jgi:hypothetical protein